MKRLFLCALFALAAIAAKADKVDPVLLRINGEPVYLSEFEYSYNKNANIANAVEHKSVEEYVDMFVNYKLKVLAAQEAHLDTLSSFRKEYAHYRDLQLLPNLIDTAYIDSVAYSLYDRSAKQLRGQDMLKVAHILLTVKQSASEQERANIKLRADSIYRAILGGADFADLAKRYSQDAGTARNGGQLPWLGPGMTIKDFEDVAYTLQPGQVSQPFPSVLGFHIVKMFERRQLEPYDSLRSQILISLRKQGIEEASAEHRIVEIMASRGKSYTREMVLDSLYRAQLQSNPDLKYLIQEYHDGLLLYEISKRCVWDKARGNKAELEAFFEKNKKNYQWEEPRFKGFIVHAKSKKTIKKVVRILKKNTDNWRQEVHKLFNRDSLTVLVQGPYLSKKGENPYIDALVFDGQDNEPKEGYPYFEVVGKKIKRPQSFVDVKSLVENDYQRVLEERWVNDLRKKYKVEIDSSVLQTVNRK